MTKILCIGDTHFKTNNIKESYDFIDRLDSYLSNNPVEYIIALGDILDKHEIVHTHALNVALDFFKMLVKHISNKVYVLVGNHDYTNNTNFLTNNHWMNSLKEWGTLCIVDDVTRVDIGEHNIVMCPYVPDGRFVEALNTLEGWLDSRIIFGHQLLDGCKMGAIIAENVEEWKDEYPLLVSGHIHDKQQIKPNLYYTGSSMQHAFGESGDKTLALIELESLDIKEIDLGLSTKRIIYIDSSELETKLENIKPKSNEQIKLVISGDEEFFKEYKKTEQLKKRLESKGITKIVFKQKEKDQYQGKDEIVKRKNDFLELLDYMTKETEDDMMISFYEHIVYNKTDKTDVSNMLIL